LTGAGELVCRSTGWIAGAWRAVEVWRHEQGLRLKLAGLGEFAATADGIAVIAPATPGVTATTLAEALLGAPLVLGLAMNAVWCLHASAVSVDGSVIAVAGESGNGKSTLAAYLDGAEGYGWRRVADDTLPVSLGPDGLLALPHFPQLKLSPAGQYPVAAPSRLPLAAVCVIAPPNGEDSVSLRPLGQRQAVQALIRHTVAARLFTSPLLAAQLGFCASAAARVPVWRLAYPHRQDALPRVRDAIDRALSRHGAERGRRAATAATGK
jgi:hypothetical protein